MNRALARLCGSGVLLFTFVLVACAAAAGTSRFQRESPGEYENQVRHKEVHAATFHEKRAGGGHLHASLNDGRRMTIGYLADEQAHLVALTRASGVPLTVAVVKPTAKSTHHTLRYIAGGILVLVIVVVLIVLLVGRRRALLESDPRDQQDAREERPSSPSSPH